MAAEAEATREAGAKVIAAEGEHKASRALKHAAEVINGSPAALQVTIILSQSLLSNVKYFSVALPANPEQYFSRKQQHYHISGANRHYIRIVPPQAKLL